MARYTPYEHEGYIVEKPNDFDWYIETKNCGKMGPYKTRKIAISHAKELDAINQTGE